MTIEEYMRAMQHRIADAAARKATQRAEMQAAQDLAMQQAVDYVGALARLRETGNAAHG